jgi:hypothetical protein
LGRGGQAPEQIGGQSPDDCTLLFWSLVLWVCLMAGIVAIGVFAWAFTR